MFLSEAFLPRHYASSRFLDEPSLSRTWCTFGMVVERPRPAVSGNKSSSYSPEFPRLISDTSAPRTIRAIVFKIAPRRKYPRIIFHLYNFHSPFPFGAPLPGAPPCMRHRRRPCTFGGLALPSTPRACTAFFGKLKRQGLSFPFHGVEPLFPVMFLEKRRQKYFPRLHDLRSIIARVRLQKRHKLRVGEFNQINISH